MKKYSSLILNQLELCVNLGWPQGERIKQQIVMVDVVMRFATPPSACVSDQLDDTHCYDQLISVIKASIASRHFRLLEHLGHEIYQLIKQSVTNELSVTVRITKKPAILNLTGGVTFCFGDEA